mmetsp:Transcript_21649/g.47358  ORF Transcript_21649/g.47358 Transcript_21649/m.47358 type:complete len:203 (-) Transcript_21649:164-772(-)
MWVPAQEAILSVSCSWSNLDFQSTSRSTITGTLLASPRGQISSSGLTSLLLDTSYWASSRSMSEGAPLLPALLRVGVPWLRGLAAPDLTEGAGGPPAISSGFHASRSRSLRNLCSTLLWSSHSTCWSSVISVTTRDELTKPERDCVLRWLLLARSLSGRQASRSILFFFIRLFIFLESSFCGAPDAGSQLDRSPRFIMKTSA